MENTYIGIDKDTNGGMTHLGRIVMDGWLFGFIPESETCAGRLKQTGSINYVLTIDFAKKLLHVFPGASGDYRGPQARRITTCIERALPKPDWDTIRHQYRYYTIAILATYTPEAPAAPTPTAPTPTATPTPAAPAPVPNGQPRFD